jgi:tRNA (guanine37-N1)-methyltransferase
MHFQVITLFPEMIESSLSYGVVGQALKGKRSVEQPLRVTTLNPRRFTSDSHQSVDDRPFGGGDGMIMMAEPLALAIAHAREEAAAAGLGAHVIHVSPRGRVLNDALVRELAEKSNQESIIILSSRYGGVDQRLLRDEVNEEISIGDYVLSGGEIAALAIIDAVSRLNPGVLGNEDSHAQESFSPALENRLEHPQFTRPREWRGQEVPAVFLSGDHAKIAEAKWYLSLLTTVLLRPALVRAEHAGERKPGRQLSRESSGDVGRATKLGQLQSAERWLAALTDSEWQAFGLHVTRDRARTALRDAQAALNRALA